LDFGSSTIEILPSVIGTPTVSHSLSWSYYLTNNIPFGNVYHEGDNVVTWTVRDEVCGYEETCQQHVYVTFPQCPDAVDCEGNVYHGVRIDCDCWTERNLESKYYGNPGVCEEEIPCAYEYSSPSYPNTAENVAIYGRLYCAAAVLRDSADNGHGHIQGICPKGWYLPTPEKYASLFTHGDYALKTPNYWVSGSGGNNSTGFGWLPAGFYNGSEDRFEGLTTEGYFWSTSIVGGVVKVKVTAFELAYFCDTGIVIDNFEGLGFSVRCIKEKED
jgi:uncharacterized protein (TIGR02145 family)